MKKIFPVTEEDIPSDSRLMTMRGQQEEEGREGTSKKKNSENRKKMEYYDEVSLERRPIPFLSFVLYLLMDRFT